VWQMLHDLITLCLNTAVKDKMSSIAFPTIGCGQLNFNPAVVAECFKAAARDAGATLMVLYNCVTCYFITLLSVFSVSVHCFQKMITVALHVKERNVICDAFLKTSR